MKLNNLKVTSKNLLLIGILFLILPNISALIISEIMYDSQGADSGREWIEIYNNESNNIDLTDWKFYEGGTNHGLSLKQGNWILNSGEYAIIVDNDINFLLDYSSFNGILFDSSFSLLNTGETIILKNNSLDIINSVTYGPNFGANGDGNSLQFCDGIWKGISPTPGSVNSCAGEINNNNNSNNNSNGEESANEPISPTIEVNYPLKVSLNQEFIFKIKLINFNQDIYDVKIEIFLNGTRIAEIMNNNQWKSTIYYLNDIINSNEEKGFAIMVNKEFENADISVKIKNSNDKVEIFQGYNLSKLNNEEVNKTYNGTASGIIYLNASLTNPQNSQNEDNKINLSNTNSKDIKSENDTAKLNKNNYARYVLTAFVFLLALLFLLKRKILKKEYKNEFQEK